MFVSPRTRILLTTLLPIPIAAGLATLLLLGGCGGALSTAGSDAGGEADLAVQTVVRVHTRATGITLRGSAGKLSWTSGAPLVKGPGDVWTFTTRALRGRAEFKPLANDQAWSRGPNYAVDAGQTLDVWPRFGSDQGRVERVDQWWSNGLHNARPIWIYYPPSYDEQPDLRFPVLYLHDGQNLFDPAYSFQGVTWQVQDAMDQNAANGFAREAIVIGVGNTPGRIWEYTPSEGGYGGGGAAAYVKFLTDELKPQVDAHLRTSPDRLDTGVVGSSLGGLVSACAGVFRPDVFGLVGALSPSTWWDHTLVLGLVRGTAQSPVKPARVYVDSGDAGGQDGEPGDDNVNTSALAQAYRDVGYIQVEHLIGHGDAHTESAWARRLPGALRFLLGPRAALP